MPAEPPRRLRLLLVSPASTGGIARHVRMLADGLAARGHAVTVAAPASTLPRVVPDRHGVASVAIDVGRLRRAVPATAALRGLAHAHDVMHAHGVRVGAQAALAGGAPLVATWHNAPLGPARRRVLHRGLEQVSARRSAVVLGASGDLVARARRVGARDARLAPVAAPPREVTPRHSVERDVPTVVAIARLHPQKRIDLLIDATAGWPDTGTRPRVLVAGDGPLRSVLEARARRAGAPVQFLGERADVAALLDAADVVVLCSDWEARPLVAQEALRAGVALVATDVGGVRELVGSAALLVPPGDVGALRAALVRVLTDHHVRTQLAEAGPAQAAQWPTPEDMVTQLEQIYLDLSQR